MKKVISIIVALIFLTSIFCIPAFGAESEYNYDTLVNWGISVASPAQTLAVMEGNDYYIYPGEDGYLPYVRVNVYNGYPDNDEYEFLDELSEYMSGDYDDLEILKSPHENIINGIYYYEADYDYTVDGYHVSDRRIAKKVGSRIYLFTAKEVPELNLLIGDMLEDIIINSSFLDEDGQTIELPEASPADNSDEPIEVLLTVTVEDGTGETSEKNYSTDSYAYIVKTGDVIDIGGLSDLVITADSVYRTSVIFTANSPVFRKSGSDSVTDRFVVFKGETLHIWNDCLADAESDYYFDIADVDVSRVEDMGSFKWDIDLDDEPEEAYITFTDRGNNILSFSYLSVTSPETGKSWEAYMDGIHDISMIHTVQGSEESFLVIDALYDDYEVQDMPVSVVVIFEDNELKVYK